VYVTLKRKLDTGERENERERKHTERTEEEEEEESTYSRAEKKV
jgi:hypothetical protein